MGTKKWVWGKFLWGAFHQLPIARDVINSYTNMTSSLGSSVTTCDNIFLKFHLFNDIWQRCFFFSINLRRNSTEPGNPGAGKCKKMLTSDVNLVEGRALLGDDPKLFIFIRKVFSSIFFLFIFIRKKFFLPVMFQCCYTTPIELQWWFLLPRDSNKNYVLTKTK